MPPRIRANAVPAPRHSGIAPSRQSSLPSRPFGECHFRVLSLFAGIGGFDLGLERAGGFRTVAFCEIEPFPQSILRKHWPEAPIYDDVRELTAARLAADGIAVDVVCGGFPCQDLSEAGRRAGIEADRSGLWSEFARIIGEVRPAFALVENVPELLAGPSEQPGGWFGKVLGDLASLGYDACWNCIQAADVGAPHIRDRVWIAAVLPDASCERVVECWRKQFQKSRVAPWNVSIWADQPEPSGVADGVPNRMDRVRGTGNAVVPQIPELIGRAILAAIATEAGTATTPQSGVVHEGAGRKASPK